MRTPREKRQARTRRAILDAARRIIAEEGTDALSIRALAHRIDYSPAGLYEYFSGKEEIIATVCAEGHLRLYQAMTRVDPSLPDDVYLTELGRTYVTFAAGNPDYFLLMFSTDPTTLPGEPPTRKEILAGLQAEGSSFAILYRAIERGVANGAFRLAEGESPLELALSAWVVVHGVAVLWLTQLRPMAVPLEEIRDRSLRTYLRGIQA